VAATAGPPAAERSGGRAGELRNLTSVRFIAAIMVVLFHVRDHLPVSLAGGPVALGYVGVSFFFVLSGFILTYQNSDTVSSREFWKARFARIYPIYVVGLLLSLPFFVVTALRGEVPWFASLAAAVLLQSWLPGCALALNAPGWSLSDEAWFYASFPFAIRRVRGLTTRGALWLAAAAWIGVLLVPVTYLALMGRRDLGPMDHGAVLEMVKFHPLARLGEFGAGMAGGVIFLRQPRRPRPVLALLSALLIAVLISLRDRIPYLILHNGLFVPAFVAIVLALATTDVPVLGRRAFARLGEASYSLYILHVPMWMMISAVEKRWHRFGGTLVPVYLAVTLIVSLLAFRYIEVPMRLRLRRVRR
jgi:peptidoglycan/LPS O-acetylase OafA/YrhL